MRSIYLAILFGSLVACGSIDASDEARDTQSSTIRMTAPLAPLASTDFSSALTRTSIRGLQFWIDDATFDAKWAAMLTAPIEFFGGASSAFHADLATVAVGRIPGGDTLCHGDAKFDNFGWTKVDGKGIFSNNDFDDSGACPVAADVLRYLVATDLWFGDAALDATARSAYIKALKNPSSAVSIDPASEPVWNDLHDKTLSKDTHHDALVLGGEVQAATAAEVAAVRALVAGDARLSGTVLDVTRNVRTDGGSAGLRRFWVLRERPDGTRTIIELKELTRPGSAFGGHALALDEAFRLDMLKLYWWGTLAPNDQFAVQLLGAPFVARDRLTRTNPKPNKMSAAQIKNTVQAEASLLAIHHRAAWSTADYDALDAWLESSAATLVTRWRSAYTSAGGK